MFVYNIHKTTLDQLHPIHIHEYYFFKVKIHLSVCLIKHDAKMKDEGVEVEILAFLTSALDGSEWSVSRPDNFTPGGRTSSTYWIGGWVGSRAESGRCGENKSLLSLLVIEPRYHGSCFGTINVNIILSFEPVFKVILFQ
jgi:hypothetical protein